jgi:hypothetical protein
VKITEEVTGAEFGDKRLSTRLVAIAEQMAVEPDASFPVAACGDAALEATYRFFNNDAVSPERILEPHVRATAQRVAQAGAAIVAHDTTELAFTAEGAQVGCGPRLDRAWSRVREAPPSRGGRPPHRWM